ncbi:NmrA/HSCARG family protein [Pyxidicoccus fallax]|uniref:NmrA/HSCARG family protein n=1 Tax=Pyxidicoccus fallax TaxID=394095 RepID=A0A848LK83_9BACT|nr:NmrA/HSCARG family protein [Pyxidicoccus fallax]NMO18177.1 NmrA/HSCARG family protein [Pyxidicoccus fallax]NPC82905.1 NmrA/HSCARG family protein [Pyxidicoccus fallax]
MPMAFFRSVLVTGATGQQGGAVARQLLNRGHRVTAFVRRADSPAAEELRTLGARLAVGNLDDVDSIVQAARGMDAMYAMTTPFEAGMEAEVHQGLNQADAARLAGVRHFIFSSVAGADRVTGIPHFDTKHRVELHVRRSGLPYTILGPTFFMENFTSSMFGKGLKAGVLAMGLPPTRGLQMVALDDLSALVVRVLEEPDRFLEERIEVASDEVTGQQAAGLLSMVSGHRIHYEQLPLDLIRERSEDMAAMYEWMDRVGYHADILTLRHQYPEIRWHTFEDWARGQDWSALTSPAWPHAAAEPAPPH